MQSDGRHAQMRLYYMTDVAALIVAEGFGDGFSYGFATPIRGAGFVTDRPIGLTEGAIGEQVLQLDFPADLDLDPYELPDQSPSLRLREWCIPTAVLNSLEHVQLLDGNQTTHAWLQSWRPTHEHSTT